MGVSVYHRNHTYPVGVAMVVWECPACGIVYGIPQRFADEIRQNGGGYYCPNGHHLSWDETEEDRQRKRAERAERRLAAEQDTSARWRRNAEAERRSAIAYKGHLTRMRNRIANGVCPVPGCKRSGFAQVLRHIATQHPGWLADHPEVAE